MDDAEAAGRRFTELVRIMDALRGEGGCPWDREQDEKSIADFFLEEVYEAVDAIYDGDASGLAEELGDVLMEVVFLSRIFKEKGEFEMSRVLAGINNKMIRRHPHVFGGGEQDSVKGVKRAWNSQKRVEKGRDSLFDGMTRSTPALLRAFQVGQRASLQGFDWGDPDEVAAKVREELEEFERAREQGKADETVEELGDLLFALVNLARHMRINPEVALNRSSEKFMRRFRHIERRLREQGKDIDRASLQEMDAIWDEAKREE